MSNSAKYFVLREVKIYLNQKYTEFGYLFHVSLQRIIKTNDRKELIRFNPFSDLHIVQRIWKVHSIDSNRTMEKSKPIP